MQSLMKLVDALYMQQTECINIHTYKHTHTHTHIYIYIYIYIYDLFKNVCDTATPLECQCECSMRVLATQVEHCKHYIQELDETSM